MAAGRRRVVDQLEAGRVAARRRRHCPRMGWPRRCGRSRGGRPAPRPRRSGWRRRRRPLLSTARRAAQAAAPGEPGELAPHLRRGRPHSSNSSTVGSSSAGNDSANSDDRVPGDEVAGRVPPARSARITAAPASAGDGAAPSERPLDGVARPSPTGAPSASAGAGEGPHHQPRRPGSAGAPPRPAEGAHRGELLVGRPRAAVEHGGAGSRREPGGRARGRAWPGHRARPRRWPARSGRHRCRPAPAGRRCRGQPDRAPMSSSGSAARSSRATSVAQQPPDVRRLGQPYAGDAGQRGDPIGVVARVGDPPAWRVARCAAGRLRRRRAAVSGPRSRGPPAAAEPHDGRRQRSPTVGIDAQGGQRLQRPEVTPPRRAQAPRSAPTSSGRTRSHPLVHHGDRR